ncbi:MAG: radical SAM protein [Desulfobacteraceae bacterium]|nr:radical SAM protein [Desulfobacteraceae bacterium]MBC2757912.1 radical SAM protein [Desulfobacteraceae bacterium]
MTDNLIYGPVPSRRLGFSLGVDLVPYKICSYNCIYCQIGPTPETTIERKPYISSEKILSQLFDRLKEGIKPDYITLGGSGEPTLNSGISDVIKGIKSYTDVPVTVLTNGSLLMNEEVRKDLCRADVVLPSFDACDESTYLKINRPHSSFVFEEMANGLIEFRKIYPGEIWLEIFIVEGINATESMIKKFKQWTDRINPDKIHLNTAVRPTAETYVYSVPEEKLAYFCEILGKKAEVIAPFKKEAKNKKMSDTGNELLSMLSRRPCTLADISAGLGLHQHEILKYVEPMITDKHIEVLHINGKMFYQKKDKTTADQS